MKRDPQKIRPAARLIKTIGQDLIKDTYAAIVELVKNAYDADSPDAVVRFKYDESKKLLTICIEDHGHGMNFDTVVNKWLVPATDDKLNRKRSGRGRTLQGRKGIGRFAATILGERVLLETTTHGKATSLFLDMEALEKCKYLDDFELDIDESDSLAGDGTKIEIEKSNISVAQLKDIWTPNQLRKLLVELRSLTAPEEVYKIAESQGFKIDHDKFEIQLIFEEFPVEGYAHRNISIEPFPVLDLYDYKISGKVDNRGVAHLVFENSNVPVIEEKIDVEVPLSAELGHVYPGDIYVDLRAFDRDPDSIDNLIKRGLKDPDTNEYVGKHEARRILDESYGVGIYREQFRIRPYGEQSFDWLDLDKKRVQNPSFKIGHNQLMGFVYIRSEELSGVREKSARDGLVENGAYFGLLAVVSRVINELEARRFSYRQRAMKGRRSKTLEDEVNSLFDFDEARKAISKELNQIGVSREQGAKIQVALEKALDDERQKKAVIISKIRDTIAIYQGQATLGKITHVILHEGRKNIKYLTEAVPRVAKWAEQLAEKPDAELLQRLKDRSEKTVFHATGLSYLFKKIEPFARTRRAPSRELNLEKELKSALSIFSSELEEAGIVVSVRASANDLVIKANELDVMTIFSNLIENSIFWLGFNKGKPKSISATLSREGAGIVVDFRDSGPGFQGGNLELMFEPGYSMKPDGTGLGLALAGEAMSRIGGKIEAKRSDDGAAFELTFQGEKRD